MAVFDSCKTTSRCNEQGHTPPSSSGCLWIDQLFGSDCNQQQRSRSPQSLDCLPANVPRSLRPFDMDRSEIKLIPTSGRSRLEVVSGS